MRMIELKKLTGSAVRTIYNDTDEPGEAAPTFVPVMVNAETIRCFTPRRDNQPGTRITFADGGGFPVKESYDEVKAMVMPAN